MNVRHVLGISALVLLLVFVLQNMEVVTVEFLVWDVQASRIIIYLTIFLIGLFIGWLIKSVRR